MSTLVPNLDELLGLLAPDSAGAEVTSAFDTEMLDEAQQALRSVVLRWEGEGTSLLTGSTEG